jgi:DNA repair exonuclease SbcCD ATPase subunit
MNRSGYEAGRVKDTSKDPSGGSTGGGKISGANKEGLRGVPPQQIQQKMDRLADQQADIRNVSEKAKVALQKRGYVSEDLAKAIERMKQIEDQLRHRQGANYTAEAKAVAEKLDALKKTIQDQLDITRDPTKSLSKDKRSELLNAMDEEIPAEFKDWVKEYYKALSTDK